MKKLKLILLCTSAFVLTGTIANAQDAKDENVTKLPTIKVTTDKAKTYKASTATIGGKTPQTIREIPNSVSVITKQQIEDQNLRTIQEVLTQTTGVNVISNDTVSSQYYSRGYALGVMYDGVTSYNGLTPSHQFDTVIYDRVEVLRGPAGILRGVGEPGGVVNLVKKKPQSNFGASLNLSTGSYSNNRVAIDLTGPLIKSKAIRGLVSLSSVNRDFFYDYTHEDKFTIYTALEVDLLANTTLGANFTSQASDLTNPWSGIPTSSTTDANGHFLLLDVPVSTFYSPEWGRQSYSTNETNTYLEHKFDNGWKVKANYNLRQQNFFWKYGYTYSSVNATTNRLDYAAQVGDYDYTREGYDIFVAGPVKLFGRTHDLTLGFNQDNYLSSGISGSNRTYRTGVLWGDMSNFAEPEIAYSSGSQSRTRQNGIYIQAKANLLDNLKFVFGGRTTNFKAASRSIAPSTTGLTWKAGAKADNEFTPYAGIVYDITDAVTLYTSYADIFVPQTQLKADGSTLDPRTGRQFEYGVKTELLDGKLSATFALFDLKDKNRAYADPAYPNNAYYLNAGEISSKGYETELSGQVLPGLQIVAGYTYLKTQYEKDRTNQGKTYSIQSPKYQFKLWSDYTFAQSSVLNGLDVGLGVIAYSSAQSSRGWRDEVVNKGYKVANARIGYKINEHYSVDLTVNNIFDKKYYESVGTPNVYNFYGSPRSFILSAKAKY